MVHFSLKVCVLSDVRIRFGHRVRTLRERRGLTQTQLADQLGIDRSFLSDVERGMISVSFTYLETLADGFNITVDQLLMNV